jgi:ABC-type transport system involved in multi-copper enzyme maturation permease subunit
VWKELRQPLLTQNKILATIMGLILLAAGVTLLVLAARGMWEPLHAALILVMSILPLLFMVRVGTAAAGAVTREKEARTWPILLACPLENAEIVRGKIIGVLRRALPLLAPIPVLFLMVCLFGEINLGPQTAQIVFAVIMSIVTYAGHVFFLMGLGLYLSTRLKTTSTAVAATLGSYFGVAFLCCCALGPLSMVFGVGGPGGPVAGLFMTNMLHACVFGAAGFCFTRAAKSRLRRDVFGSG